MDRLVLNEFKAAYRALQPRLVKPLDFLVYGLLVWLQSMINHKCNEQVCLQRPVAAHDKPLI